MNHGSYSAGNVKFGKYRFLYMRNSCLPCDRTRHDQKSQFWSISLIFHYVTRSHLITHAEKTLCTKFDFFSTKATMGTHFQITNLSRQSELVEYE